MTEVFYWVVDYFDILTFMIIMIVIIEIISTIIIITTTVEIVDPSWIRFVETGGNYAWSHDRHLGDIIEDICVWTNI